jgi:hypothetical protein
MSNAFRVKNRLNLTPQATEPTGLELGDLWMDAEGTLKRWDGTASQDVGSGGVGSVDIMFADTFDATNISEYTTTGTVAVTDNVLEVIQGKKSLKITHTGGASAERIIPVDIKFRNKNVTFSFDVESDALSGNLTLTVTDNTNTVTLINAESIQPQGSLDTSIKRSVSFIIPDDCEELKYKFTAVSESGKISIIDNVVIELTQTAKLSTTIEVPVITEEVDAGAITIGAVTTAPTKGTTSTDKVYWHREGQFLVATYRYAQTATGSAGSGDYLFTIPDSLQVDTSQIIPYTGAVGTNISHRSVIGTGARWDSGNTHGVMHPILYSATQFRIRTDILYSSVSFMSSTNTPLSLAGVTFTVSIKVPIVGWSATETQEVSLAQAVLKQESDSFIRLDTANGYGSTGTVIRRFSNVRSTLGDDVLYVPSSVNGDSFVIQTEGTYSISYTDEFNVAGNMGITLNASGVQLSTVFQNLPNTVRLASDVTGGVSYAGNASWTGYLNVGDVIRPHTDGSASGALGRCLFSISKQGSLKQVNVTENQKIAIPTSELRMEGASTRGTGSDSAIVRFDNIAKLRGDAFTVESTAALGTVVTMKKKGKLQIVANYHSGSNAGDVALTKNQQTRTTATALAGEIIATAFHNGTYTPTLNIAGEVFVEIGDVIRLAANAAPTANAKNSLQLFFQEQEVAVSVTNVLPQFSESDSSVRVDTANGYGSGAGFTSCRRFSNNNTNLGSAITYVDSPTEGAIFTINEDAEYAISYSEMTNAATAVGIAKNPISGGITSQSANSKLAMSTVPQANFDTNVAWQGKLQKGDIIKAITDGAAAGIRPSDVSFTISKVGKPNVTGVDVTPFASIEYEVKQHYSAALNSSFDISTVRRNTNEGLFTISDSGVNTLIVTALRDMEISASVYEYLTGATAYTVLSATNHAGQTIMQGVSPWEAGSGFGGGNIAITTEVLAGQTLTFTRVQNSGSYVSSAVEIVATELRDAYQVIGGGIENLHTATVQSGTSTILARNTDFLTVSRVSTGTYNVTYKFPLVSIPSVVVTCTQDTNETGTSGLSNYGYAHNFTSTGFSYKIGFENGEGGDGGSLADRDHTIQLVFQGSDYRTPSKAIGLPQQRIAYIKDVKADSTAGGTSSSGVYQTRVLNTLQDPTGIVVSLASNTFTLSAGTYDIQASAPCFRGIAHKIRLRNITDTSTTLVGVKAYTTNTDSVQTDALLAGTFTITSQKSFTIEHFIQTGLATEGLGVSNASGGDNAVFTQVRLMKLEE